MTGLEARILACADLAPVDRLVLIWLAHALGEEPGAVAMTEMAAAAGVTDTTARKVLGGLIDTGWVIKHGVLQEKRRRLVVSLNLGRIEPKGNATGTVVATRASISNLHISSDYNKYPAQDGTDTDDAAARASAEGGGSPMGSSLVVQGARRLTPPAPRRQKIRVPCPANFEPAPQTRAAIAKLYPRVDVERELVRFIHYWTIGKGAGEMRPGWDGSFLTWCDKAGSPAPRAAAGPGGATAVGGAASAPPPRNGGRETSTEWLSRLRDGDWHTTIDHEGEP